MKGAQAKGAAAGPPTRRAKVAVVAAEAVGDQSDKVGVAGSGGAVQMGECFVPLAEVAHPNGRRIIVGYVAGRCVRRLRLL
jgi:hypothetical protein